jgi:predicted Co/Zn/Cd cation transporter (cation efflux family)
VGGPAGVAHDERRALRVSVVATLAIAALAVVWGLVSGARIVLLDGAYALIGVVLTGASLRASAAADAGPSARYPFGRESFTPLVIALQGAALIGTLAFAAADAVVLLRTSGSSGTPVAVLAYGALTAVAAGAVALWLPRRVRGSELVVVEGAQWRASAVLSAVMAVGAGLALALTVPFGDAFTPYVDPVLVLVACAVLVPVPLRMLRDAGRELTEAAAPEPVLAAVRAAVAGVRARHPLPEPDVRATKLGRKLYVEVDYVVAPGAWDVSDEDDVRRQVLAALRPLPYDVWANVELTTDPELLT